MNAPGGKHNRATAAYGSFPYPMRTVAEIDAAEIEAKIAAKVRRELNGLRLIERAKLSHNIPHNLTYRDTAIPTLLPSRRSGRVNQRIDAPATIGSNLLHGVPNA